MTNIFIKLIAKTLLGSKTKILNRLPGGMMNLSFVVTNNNKKYVLYIPTKNANKLVNRELEKSNQELAHNLSLTSKNVFFDTKKGIKINQYIEGDSLNHIQNINYNAVAVLLKKLHQSKVLSEANYDPFKRLEKYEMDANKYQKETPELYKKLRALLYQNKDFLEQQKLVLCHNDSQKSNIINSKDNRYYLIDFEFAANNDPLYDIAAFGNDHVDEGLKVLYAYTNNHPSNDELKRFFLWRIFLSLQWCNIAIVKHYQCEGKRHHINFIDVANHFLANANTAAKQYQTLK